MDALERNIQDPVIPDEEFLRWQKEDLAEKLPGMMESRQAAGIDDLVLGLAAVIINTEQGNLEPAVQELLNFTGLETREHFVDPGYDTYVLGTTGSADVLVRTRKSGVNPFYGYNQAEKARHLPDTRLETFVFLVAGLDEYVRIQKNRGVVFLTDRVLEYPGYLFIQTVPSAFTGNSLGFIEWKGEAGSYASVNANAVPIIPRKPAHHYLSRICGLDHAATRVRAKERNPAILEFLSLTGYHFDFAVFVRSQNSVTSVARRDRDGFAMVFTSGISPFSEDKVPGPTERFIHSYGTRVHHMAFRTEEIDGVFRELESHGMKFLVELVGSPGEGLKQTFTMPSPYTLLVNEYIQRYEGFSGFFSMKNVEELTRATGRQ